jgi:hypothetical protein
VRYVVEGELDAAEGLLVVQRLREGVQTLVADLVVTLEKEEFELKPW